MEKIDLNRKYHAMDEGLGEFISRIIEIEHLYLKANFDFADILYKNELGEMFEENGKMSHLPKTLKTMMKLLDSLVKRSIKVKEEIEILKLTELNNQN